MDISRSLFLNADSLAFYAERAYLDDDPKRLFVTGMAAHLRHYDPSYFFSKHALRESIRPIADSR